MKLRMLKLPNGDYRPYDEPSVKAARRHRSGAIVEGDFVQPRNWKFHKKYFVLLRLGYDYWEPPERTYRGMQVAKNFDRFREEVAVLAGHYDVVWTLEGEMRLRPRSISWADMDAEEFEKLYSATGQVLIDRVLAAKGFTAAEVDRVVDQILRMDD